MAPASVLVLAFVTFESWASSAVEPRLAFFCLSVNLLSLLDHLNFLALQSVFVCLNLINFNSDFKSSQAF